MKKLYLVTGANGHLGGTLLRLLKKQSAEIRGLILPSEQPDETDGVCFIRGDVRDIQSLRPLSRTFRTVKRFSFTPLESSIFPTRFPRWPMRSMSTEPKTSSRSAGNTGSAVCSTSARFMPSPRVTNPPCSMR